MLLCPFYFLYQVFPHIRQIEEPESPLPAVQRLLEFFRDFYQPVSFLFLSICSQTITA